MKKISIIVIALVAILVIATYISVSETKDTFRTCKILNVDEINAINFKEFDSVIVAANTLYDASYFKKIMQGEQYRNEWSTPIIVPIAFLDTLKGGLKVIEAGGGKQTHSLELEDSLGIRYTLRSLSKDPEKLVPNIAKQLGIENIVVDGISAQHPYAALAVSKLAEAAAILHTNPKLFFIPEQKTLNDFNSKFGNRLYYFEYESEGEINWLPLKNIKEIVDTEDLQELKIKKGNAIQIDKQALIRARLFDFIIGDWDRHAKQWGWALQKNNEELIAIPIAADRDNAFFHQEGILPTLITNNITLPEVQAFEKEINNLEGLVSSFDTYFLKTAEKEDFISEANTLKKKLNSKSVDKAFEIWPKAIDSLNGKIIREKINTRIRTIDEYAIKFFEIIQDRPLKNAELKGSSELFLGEKYSQCFDCLE